MEAVSILKELVTLNRNGAKFIYLGIAVFAAGAVVIAFNVDPWAAAKVGSVVVGFAVLLSLILYIVAHPAMKAVLAWFLVSAVVYFMLCVMAAAFPRSIVPKLVGPQPPLTCLLNMLNESVEVCEARNAPTVTVVNAPSASLDLGPEQLWFAQDATVPSDNQVFLQYAEPVGRDTAQQITRGLTTQGWGVEGADLGGEMVAKAPTDNEVRFFKPEDQAKAIALAKSLSQLIGGAEITVRDFSKLYPYAQAGHLEMWLGSSPIVVGEGL
jgi:hypothetical protein